MTYTLGGEVLVVPTLPTYAVVPDTLVASGQTISTLTPTGAPSQMGIIYGHPLGGVGSNILTDLVCLQLARWGFPVVGGQLGGMTAWDNTLSQTHMDICADYLIDTMGSDPDHFGLYCISMGGTSSLKWASNNLNLVDGWASLAGCISMDYFYTTQSQITIDAAFASQGGWPANAATHDPQLLAEAGALDGLHGKLWYGSNDTTIGSPATAEAFIAEVPTVEGFEYQYGTGGHFDVVLSDAVSIATFLARSYVPTANQFVPVT